jgi:hypothetical protein
MKVVLQNMKTRLFVEESGTWISKIDRARGFINSGEAIDYAFQHKLTNVEVILWFPEQNYSLTIPFEREQKEELGETFSKAQPEERKRIH